MKTKLFLALLTALPAFLSPLAAQTNAPAAPDSATAVAPAAVEPSTAPVPALTVAVLPFESSSPANQGKAAETATLLAAQLSAVPEIWLVERAEIDKLLGEQAINLSGLADPATAVQTGRLIGAKVLITGRYIQTGETAVFVAKIISVETSRVFGETASAPANGSLDAPTRELAAKVMKILSDQKAALSPPREDPAKRLEKLKQLVAGKTLPTLNVAITERDIREVTIDPAVQTEVEKLLTAVGFTLESADRAQVLVTGEAFSQASARHGDIVSSRARAEIRATRMPDKKVLAVDRETAAAVDTAPAVAAKSALQSAGLTLAERLVPKLANP